MTTVSDMLFDLGGVPVRAPITQGKHIFVDPRRGLDGNSGLALNAPRNTLTAALALVPANDSPSKGDTVYLLAQSNTVANTTDYQTSTLTWSKDFTNLIGANGPGNLFSPRSRISTASTAVGTDVAPLVTVSANGCLWQDIAVFAGVPASAPTGALGAMLVSGDHNVFRRCHIGGCGDSTMDAATQYSLMVTGSENLFEDCTIGLDTVSGRTGMLYEMLIGSVALQTTRNVFRRCRFVTRAGAATMTWITTVASGLQRNNYFENCTFSNNVAAVNSGVLMNQGLSAADLSGSLVFTGQNCFEGATAFQTSKTAAVQATTATLINIVTNTAI